MEGPAEIVRTDNGDMQRPNPFTGSGVHLYGGRTSAALRITGKGRLRVMVYAPGPRSASTAIMVE